MPLVFIYAVIKLCDENCKYYNYKAMLTSIFLFNQNTTAALKINDIRWRKSIVIYCKAVSFNFQRYLRRQNGR